MSHICITLLSLRRFEVSCIQKRRLQGTEKTLGVCPTPVERNYVDAKSMLFPEISLVTPSG